MSDIIIAFVLVVLVSALGSLQLGPVNTLVINSTLNNSRGVWKLAVGGALPECIYSALAILTINGFFPMGYHQEILKIIGSMALITIGCILLISELSSNHKITKAVSPINKPPSVMMGFVCGIANPQLVLFWTLVLGYISVYLPMAMEHQYQYAAAVISGSGIGAYVALIAIHKLAHRYRAAIISHITPKVIHLILGVILVAIGAMTISLW